MENVVTVNPSTHNFRINRDLSVTIAEKQPGPPRRIDGMTVGLVPLAGESPHNGEMHPDGDEIIMVISGRLSLQRDSAPGDPLIVSAGEACVVRKGEWHRIDVLEEGQMLHITPGPNGEHRPKEERDER